MKTLECLDLFLNLCYKIKKEIIMRAYCARPITGCTYQEVVEYYQGLIEELQAMGFETLFPLCAKSYLRCERDGLKPTGYTQPLSTNHAIKTRDKWMINMSDILYLNLTGAKSVSIGCVMELAWAEEFNCHTIVVMEKENIHQHAFVLECADVVFDTEKEAVNYLDKLIHGDV
jgi:hypothetical protein